MKPSVYLQTLIGTLTTPQFYIRILNSSFWFSFRFVFISYLIIGIALASVMILFDFPQYQNKFNQSMVEVEQNFPSDLEISWQQQKLSINREVLVVPYPSFFPELDSLPTSFITFIPQLDESNPETSFQFVDASSYFLVSDSHFLFTNINNQWQNMELNQIPGMEQDFTITKNSIPYYTHLWKTEFSEILQTFKKITIVAYPAILFIIRFWFALFNSLICYFFLKLFNKNFPWKKVFQICLHLLIPAELITQITSRLYPSSSLPMFELTFWITFLVLAGTLRKVGKIKLSRHNK